MTDQEQIVALYREMYRYMIAKDTASLGRILADDFVLVHMTGMRQSKQEYLRAIANGTLNYYSEELDAAPVQIDDDKARLRGQSRVNAAVFGGGRHTWKLQLDITLKRDGSGWIITGARASTY